MDDATAQRLVPALLAEVERLKEQIANQATSKGTSQSISNVTGHPEGPYPIGVTTMQLDDHSRTDPDETSACRRLQTEVWYPAAHEARHAPKNLFSEFLGRGSIEGRCAHRTACS